MDIIAFLLAWSPEILRAVAVVLVLTVLRWPILWYFGVIQSRQKQEETNKLLRIIANQNRPKNPAP